MSQWRHVHDDEDDDDDNDDDDDETEHEAHVWKPMKFPFIMEMDSSTRLCSSSPHQSGPEKKSWNGCRPRIANAGLAVCWKDSPMLARCAT
jgi:ABC-type Zn2+ transport system substrate-binding protein/surface adhesin